jgi:hypothetical protein
MGPETLRGRDPKEAQPLTGSTEWTVATLKEHNEALRVADQRLADERQASNQRAIDAAITAVDRAMVTATAALDKRRDTLNELRGVVSDQQATFIPRAEFESSRRQTLEDANVGVIGKRAGWQLQLGALGGVVGVVAVLITAANFLLR